MKRWLFVLVTILLSSVSTASAQTVTNGTCAGGTTSSSGCAVITVSGFGTVGIQITGTFVGTLSFEQTNDDNTWVALTVTNVVSKAEVTTTTGAGLFVGSAAGVKRVRVRFSAYTSGSATIYPIKTDARIASGGGASGNPFDSCGDVGSVVYNASGECGTIPGSLWDGTNVTLPNVLTDAFRRHVFTYQIAVAHPSWPGLITLTGGAATHTLAAETEVVSLGYTATVFGQDQTQVCLFADGLVQWGSDCDLGDYGGEYPDYELVSYPPGGYGTLRADAQYHPAPRAVGLWSLYGTCSDEIATISSETFGSGSNHYTVFEWNAQTMYASDCDGDMPVKTATFQVILYQDGHSEVRVAHAQAGTSLADPDCVYCGIGLGSTDTFGSPATPNPNSTFGAMVTEADVLTNTAYTFTPSASPVATSVVDWLTFNEFGIPQIAEGFDSIGPITAPSATIPILSGHIDHQANGGAGGLQLLRESFSVTGTVPNDSAYVRERLTSLFHVSNSSTIYGDHLITFDGYGGSAYGTVWNFASDLNLYGSDATTVSQAASGTFSLSLGSAVTASSAYALKLSLNLRNAFTGPSEYAGLYMPAPDVAGTAASAIAGYGVWVGDFAGLATNAYYTWFDSRGVYRIREDSTFDSVGQAIATLYNPQFTKYTPGAANFERLVEGRWNGNVAEIGSEKGGTGTLRNFRLIGGGLEFGSTLVAPASSGTRFLCISTAGVVTSSASACSGT